MSLITKVKDMLGFTHKPRNGKATQDYIGPEMSRAVERNELASVRAREALQDLKRHEMLDTVRQISGKM